MAKGGYQRQRLQQKKDAERKARKRARRNKVAAQWAIGIAVLALLGTVLGVTLTGGKKKPLANPSASPSASITPSPSPTPYYLIPGCTKPSSAKPNGKQFKKAPPMTIDKSKTYIVTVKTTCGTMTWKLDPKIAPIAVNNIVFLVKQHFYDNTIIHRVNVVTAADAASSGGSPYAIVQGGDPTGTGSGGPGYQYTGEAPPKGEKFPRGTLALANANSLSTDGSQFFVVVQSWPTLPPQYTVFGTVTGAASFMTLDRMIKAQGSDLGQGLGISPNPKIKIISATVAVQ
ncbi:MAG: peptidylprolyl isomerase [Actinobacteria bacterium]|nr:MAG: peptidylprolyl isomerase [Actinomycetota bacterium]